MDWIGTLNTIVKATEPILLLVLTAAGGLLVAYLRRQTRKLDEEHRTTMTIRAVNATNQLLPDADGPVKLANTISLLGPLADRATIEAEVYEQRPWTVARRDAVEPASASDAQTGMEASCGE